MNRLVAKKIHETTNLSYWMENPRWRSGNLAFDLLCLCVRSLPFSLHKVQKKLFFDYSKLLSVNGETVVVAHGSDKVEKFMFRYPKGLSTEQFKEKVSEEVARVAESLPGIAVPTKVSIKSARIFRWPVNSVRSVVQTQPKLDLSMYEELDLNKLAREKPSRRLDRTLRDLKSLLVGVQKLKEQHGYYPDIANNSGNLRRSKVDGSVVLIDVMPVYVNGNRLIDDNPPKLIEHIQENIKLIKELLSDT